MDDPLAFPWALICSVQDGNCIPQLKKFALWLTSTLQKRAFDYGFTHRFDEYPKSVFHIAPGNKEEIQMTYDLIHKDYPEVIVVFHILPVPNSVEYHLMKKLTNDYDLIRQGILLEKALTHFEECDINEVYGNILQWFSRRISRFIAPESKSCAKFGLRIGKKDEKATEIKSFTMNNITAAVQKVLHNKDDDTFYPANVKAVVQVSGYPEGFSEFEIANIFQKLRIMKISKSIESGAMVEFANEFHAAQAAIDYHEKFFDSIHPLSVIPTHPAVRREVKLAHSFTF